MYGLALLMHRHAAVGHPVLPTDERSQPTKFGISSTQPRTIAMAIDELLRVGRHELAVVVGQIALLVDDDEAVKDGPLWLALVHDFIDAHHHSNPLCCGLLAECGDLRAVDSDTILPGLCKYLLDRLMVPPARIGAMVQPCRVTTQPRFAKDDQSGTASGSLLQEGGGLVEAFGFIEIDRTVLDDSNAQGFHRAFMFLGKLCSQ